VINTSFNIVGKPIVDRLEDVLAVFTTTGLDHVAVGQYLISAR
jgi:carbamoyltransferase